MSNYTSEQNKIKRAEYWEYIKKYNIMCAKFLGYELITPNMRKNPENWTRSYWQKNYPKKQIVLCEENNLCYDCDWNWIMKVLKEIREVINTKLNIHDFEIVKEMKLNLNPYDYDIEQIVQAIDQFLTWYNKQTKISK